jgi:hypothetical protein
MGLDQYLVRQISGHAPNSKEFYRYVSFSQSYVDDKIEEIHRKLALQG